MKKLIQPYSAASLGAAVSGRRPELAVHSHLLQLLWGDTEALRQPRDVIAQLALGLVWGFLPV